MDPVLVLAVIVRVADALRETPTSTVPTIALVVTLYRTELGTRMVMAPTSVAAVTAVGGAEKTRSIVPADTCTLALADDRFCPRIDPALLMTSTGPASELRLMLPALTCAVTGPVSVPRATSPAPSVTRTVVVRGTVMM
jgi:hypothetical protein